MNLFGGSVVAEARGRGVYRALTLARWDLAVAQGTPALTIQAGRMSKPIAERLGFQLIDTNPRVRRRLLGPVAPCASARQSTLSQIRSRVAVVEA